MEKRCKFFRPRPIVPSVMARSNNLPVKKHKAGERTHTKLTFKWDAGDGNSTNTIYIDLAQAMSQLNRRAYRQGLYYYVASVGFSNGTEAYCQVNTLPDTWVTKTAWLRGFRNFQKMNRKAVANDGILPKYHDFKTQMVNGATLAPVIYGDIDSATAYSSDDWVISKFVTEDPTLVDDDTGTNLEHSVDDPDVFTSHMLGSHVGSSGTWTSIGLIRSLNDVWRYDPAEGVPSLDGDADTDPISNLFDAGDNLDDVRLNLDTDGDEPPYNHDVMPGATSVEETCVGAVIRTSGGAGAYGRAPGFCAPLGLLQVNISDFGAGTSVGPVELHIELVPGTYHGIHAERMI